MPWPWVVVSVLAVSFGAPVGAQHAWLESQPGGGLWSNNLFSDLIAGALVGLFGLIGLVSTALGKKSGPTILIGVVSFGIGWGGGATFGPRWQAPRDVAGTVTLHLLAPVGADLSSAATCTTEANGDRIVSISARGVGTVGVDELALRVESLDMPWLELTVNGIYGYGGQLTEVAMSTDTRLGSASFTALAEGARIGGPTGSPTVSGTLDWACEMPTDGPTPAPASTPGGPGPSPTAVVLQDSIQGYFDLHGLVEWTTCPNGGPCQPYGHASGACSSALDLRTDAVETVVPWTNDRQARLVVEPGRTSSTLTVFVDDGSAPEIVTASTALAELQVGPYIGARRIEGDFELAEGTLHLFVEWECGEAVEEPAE